MSNIVSTGSEFLYDVVDLTDNSKTVYTGETLLREIFVNTANVSDCPIKDGATTVFTIPASTPAGSVIVFGDVRFGTSLIVDPDDSDTGSFTVIYKPA